MSDMATFDKALAARYPNLTPADRRVVAVKFVEFISNGIADGSTPCLIGTNGRGEYEFATLTTLSLATPEPEDQP